MPQASLWACAQAWSGATARASVVWAGAQSVIVDLGDHGDDGVGMTDDEKQDETRSPLEEKILEVLADHDYNDGAGMHWHPSKTPTEQALRVSARLAKELTADREAVDRAVGEVLFNASNYPERVQPHILGENTAPLRAKITDAVLAVAPAGGVDSWEKPALDRLQELAEERGYSRGFDVGWKSRGDTDKKARPLGAKPGDSWVISFRGEDGERVVMDVDPVAAIDQLSLVATREDPALAAALGIESVKEMKHVILVIRDALRKRSQALELDMPKTPEALTKALAGTIAGIS